MRATALTIPLIAAFFAAIPSPPARAGCDPLWITGEPVPGLASQDVHDVVVYDDGDGPALYIGGGIDLAGTVQVKALARWDGTSFSAPGEILSGAAGQPFVHALAVYDGKLIVGGNFNSAGGIGASNIAAWDGSSWSALGTGVTGGQGSVWDLFVHDGKLVATGSFNAAGGVPANNIAAWDGTSWSALGGGLTGGSPVGRALTQFEGDLVASGTFLSADGNTVNRIARWDGSAWSAFGAGLPGSIYAVAVFDVDGSDPEPERLVAGGGFTLSGPKNLAYWDGATWLGLGGGTQNDVYALLPSGDDLLVGGFFTGVGGSTTNAQHVARWTPAIGWSAFGAGLNEDIGGSYVYALAEFAGDLYAVGNFTYSDQRAMYRIARWDGTAWNALSPGIGGPHSGIQTLLPWGDGVVVGGEFTSVGDAVDANNVALWTPTGWTAMGDGLGDGEYNSSSGGEWVEDLEVHDGEIHAAFYNYNGSGSAGARISRWDGAAWQPIVVTPSASHNILALQSHDGDLYAAGSFLTIGGLAANRIARWDGASWSTLGTGVNTGQVNAMASFEGDLVVGGTLTQAGGSAAFRVARWNGTSWSDMGAGLVGTESSVHCFAMHGGALYAGSEYRVYRWDGAAWTPVILFGPVHALASVDTDLYLAGRFHNPGGNGTFYVARWDGTTVHELGAGLGGEGGGGLLLSGGYALAVLADGSIALGTSNLPLADGEVSYNFARFVPCAGSTSVSDLASTAAARWAGLRLAGSRLAGGGAAFDLLLPSSADAKLVVYDVLGREIARWHEPSALPGRRVLTLDELAAGGAASGVYFARLEARAGNDVASRVARAVHVR